MRELYEELYNNHLCDLTIFEKIKLSRMILNDCIDTIIDNEENIEEEEEKTAKKMVIDLIDATKNLKKLEM